MTDQKIYDFLYDYNLANLAKSHEYTQKIKSVKDSLTISELKDLKEELKINLNEDFESNLNVVSKKLDFDLTYQVDNPYIEGNKIPVLNRILLSINAFNHIIIKNFEKELLNL